MQALQDCLDTLREVITSHQSTEGQHEPTPSEYFAVITATLSSGRIGDKLPVMLKVFSAVIPSTNTSILRSQFKPVSQLLTTVIQNVGENTDMLSTALVCISKLLAAQETADGFWSQVQSLQTLNTLLAFVDDNTPKVRKAAHDGIMALLTSHAKAQSVALRSYLADFFIGVMKSATRANYRRAHCVVVLLESSLIYILSGQLKKVMEACMKLQSCEIPRLTAAVYRMVDTLYQHPQYAQYFTAEHTVPTVNALVGMTLNTEDVETLCHYYNSLSSAVILVEKLKPTEGAKLLKKVFHTLLSGCESQFTQVHCSVGASLKRICQSMLSESTLKKSLEWYKAHHESFAFANIPKAHGIIPVEVNTVYEIVVALETVLQLKLESAWMFMLDSIRAVFDNFRGREHCAYFLTPLVHKLSEINSAIEAGVITLNAEVNESLRDTVGSSLQSCGLKTFLELVIIFDAVEEEGAVKLKVKEWVLELLSYELKNMTCKLADFMNCILPMAGKIHKMANHFEQMKDGKSHETQVRMLRNRVVQLWSLFPEMCHGRVLDIAQSFPKMKGVLTASMEDADYPEIAFAIVMGMSRLLEGAKMNELDKKALATQSTVYLPLLLKFVEGMNLGDGRFRESLNCISLWASISNDALITTISKKLLQLVLMTTNIAQEADAMNLSDQMEDAATWMAVILSMLPFMPKPLVVILFRTVRPLLSLEESVTVQKRAYNIFHALIVNHPDTLFEEEPRLNLLSLLCDSLLTAHVSSRNMRLKCIHALLDQTNDGEELRQALDLILGEVLICQKDANKKTRDEALDILTIFSKKLPAVEVFRRLCAALVAETTLMRSSAINALTLHLLRQFQKHRDGEDDGDDEVSLNSSVNEDEDSDNEDGDDENAMDVTQNYDELITDALQLLPSIQLLMTQQCTDQTKSALSYLKILSTIASREQLQDSVEMMIHSFCSELGSLKSKFSSRSRAILRKLLRKFSEEELRPMLPTMDVPLLDYIARQNRKQLRKKQLNQQKKKGNKYDRMLGSDSEEDSGDEGSRRDNASVYAATEMDVGEDYRLQAGRRVKGRLAKDNNMNQLQTSNFDDLLESRLPTSGLTASVKRAKVTPTDSSALSKNAASSLALRAGTLEQLGKKNDPEEDQFNVVVTGDGRVIIKEREVDTMSLHTTGKKENDINKAPSVVSAQKGNYGNGQGSKKRKLNLKEPGIEYRAKKAGGDIWKKGMTLQPHAYIPLDPRLLSKKHHNSAVEHFGVVVDSAKNNRKRLQVKRKK